MYEELKLCLKTEKKGNYFSNAFFSLYRRILIQ